MNSGAENPYLPNVIVGSFNRILRRSQDKYSRLRRAFGMSGIVAHELSDFHILQKEMADETDRAARGEQQEDAI